MKPVHIVYQLIARSGVLVGSTAEALSIGLDKTTVRRRRVKDPGRREPLIPGSALKGKIRNECERLLKTLGQPVCRAPRADTMCPHDRDVTNPPCPVCRIFGGPGLRAQLFFGPAVADVPGGLASHGTRVQAGVALSRKRRTAEDERLYCTERGVEGLAYQGEIDGYLDDGLAGQQLTLVVTALQRLVAIGGGKSRGAGWTGCRVKSIQVDGRPLSDEEIESIRQEGWMAWCG